MIKKLIGYSLLELIACLVITSILLLLATPAWHNIIQQQQETAITQRLTQTLNYARTQAILRKQTLIICPLANPDKVICGQDWQQGWQIMTEQAERLRYMAAPVAIPIQWRDLRQTQQINVAPNGTTEGYNGSFYYGKTQLSVNRGGRTRRVN